MFFKKDNVEVKSPAKAKAIEMINELGRVGFSISDKATAIYVRNAALICYLPNTPDHRAEKQLIEDYQKELYNMIGNYDTMRSEIIRYLNTHDLNREIVAPVESHTLISRAIGHCLNKKG